jgi:hypothetical protein
MAHKSKTTKGKKSIPLSPVRLPRPLPIRGPAYHLQHARELPFAGCWIDKEWKEAGLARVVVARQIDQERVILGVYLIDHFCLGMKNTFYRMDIPIKRLKRDLPEIVGNPKSCTPEFAHQLIYQSIEYARRYGFEPHPDFAKAGLILDPPGTYPDNPDLEFGKDGKPLYISGPYDKPERIIATLRRTAGEGNYNFLIQAEGPDFDL